MHTILAARSDFSVGESILTTEMIVKNAVAAGQKAVALTDTMSVTGMIEFTVAAKKAGIKPVIGTRLRISDDPTFRPEKGQKFNKVKPAECFVTAYALTEAGVKAIFRLLTLGNTDDTVDPTTGETTPGHFYYYPKIGFEELLHELAVHGEDLAIVLGDTQSLLQHADAQNRVSALTLACPHVYAPLVPVDTPYFTSMNQVAVSFLTAAGSTLKPLVVRPSFYGEGEADKQEIMTAIAENQKVSDPWFRSAFNRDFHVMNLGQLAKELKQAAFRLDQRDVRGAGPLFAEGLRNTDALVDSVTYEWSKAPVSLPKMADDEFATMVQECKKGWVERFERPVFGHQPTREDLAAIYMPRLKYELDVLKRLNFAGYFLLVQDIVQFAKNSGILVGPGRGSVGGSLIAYLMGITDCDPIRFGLLFERFINPERIDLPDADLDFMGTRRHEVIDYLSERYGANRVAGVNNYGTLAAASSIRDVGRVTELSERDYVVSKYVPKAHGANIPLPACAERVPDIQAFADKFPEHWEIMTRLEGTIRNFGKHASGFVIGGVDLVDRGVVEKRKDGNVVCWDKRIAEDQGLVKVDILGLLTLDIIELALRYVRERSGERINLNSFPLDDAKVLESFALAKTTGIFQFESGGMRRLLKELAVATGSVTFEDLTACTALYRPGPMESGMMDSFYLRKQGNEPIDYDHPAMKPVLEETFGVIVYQEQVMKISQVIAGYTGPQADKLRKIMGKKLPEEMAKERDNFVKGCVDTIGADERWAGALFDKIEGFAGYGFNKSHSVEYTLISYQAMWLKTYYPVEFYAAALTLSKAEKIPAILRDAKSFGVDVDVPDINNSTNRFEIVTETRLVMPFQAIKGVSSKATDAILEARAAGPFVNKDDFLKRVMKRLVNVRVQGALDAVGAFARIEEQPSSKDPSRIRDQIELLPGLITANVPVHRDLDTSREAKDYVVDLVNDYRTEHAPTKESPALPVKPFFGATASVMIISDGPTNEEASVQTFGASLSGASPVIEALENAGLSKADCYWTGLIKKQKAGKQPSAEEIDTWKPYLVREIKAIEPPVIVLLGSTVVRHFYPDWKGKASDEAGKIIYDKDLDANIVIGFSPGEIYFDPDKQANMNDVFTSVAELLS